MKVKKKDGKNHYFLYSSILEKYDFRNTFDLGVPFEQISLLLGILFNKQMHQKVIEKDYKIPISTRNDLRIFFGFEDIYGIW